MKEIWKDIRGYEGYYKVSNLGRVKSFHRGSIKGKIRVLKINKRYGTVFINLCLFGHAKSFFISQLVAKAFVPNPENKPFAIHKDSNKQNNNVKNLYWGDNVDSYNTIIENGYPNPSVYCTEETFKKMVHNFGEKSKNTKISDELAKKIYLDQGEHNIKELSEKYGVERNAVSKIINRKTWKHLDLPAIKRKSNIKITDKMKKLIRLEYSKKKGNAISYKSIAKKYGICSQSVRDIIVGKYLPNGDANETDN